MKFRITPDLRDGKANPPPSEVDLGADAPYEIPALTDLLRDEFTNDYGEPFGVGFTLTIERVA